MLRRLVAAGALVATSAVPALAQSQQDLDEIDRQIQELKESITQARGEESALAQQLSATEARMYQLRSEVETARAAVAEVQSAIGATEAQLEELRGDLAALQDLLAQTRQQIDHTRDLVRRRAVELYTEGSDQLSGMILSLEELSDLAVGLEYAEQVVASSEQLINSLDVLKRQEERQKRLMESHEAELEGVMATLQKRREELEARQAEVEAAEAAVSAEREQQRALLGRVQHQLEHFEGEIDALEEEQERIEAEIRARLAAGGRQPGVLGWPINGPISSPYGYRIHPISGIRKLHTGVDIDGSHGQPVVAAASGTVILASWYGGYGNAVVIDHGGGLATLYAHQSSMAVQVGQRVQVGEVIGYVGSTGYSTGSHLHFEVRDGGTPVDPMPYL
ncbi:MAG: peptidoglycan DD-metalloendopeptidase family protein [Actinomycetota bacterium]|nr:peptidoglycan DD-metalloendopeptidase family protein [Actinomycetota bacterium]